MEKVARLVAARQHTHHAAALTLKYTPLPQRLLPPRRLAPPDNPDSKDSD